MEICTKCGAEIVLNSKTGVWEDEDVLLCAVGPMPFLHSAPWNARNRPPLSKGKFDEIVYPGFGF